MVLQGQLLEEIPARELELGGRSQVHELALDQQQLPAPARVPGLALAKVPPLAGLQPVEPLQDSLVLDPGYSFSRIQREE